MSKRLFERGISLGLKMKFNNNRQGSALAFVLIIFLVLSILTLSILFIFNNNLKQAKRQQDSIEAYYLAYSGAELAYTALLTEVSGKKKYTTLTGSNEFTESKISFGNGKIDILAKISKDKNFEGWIEIRSTGTLDKNNQSYTRTLLFNPGNPVDRVWKNN